MLHHFHNFKINKTHQLLHNEFSCFVYKRNVVDFRTLNFFKQYFFLQLLTLNRLFKYYLQVTI